MDISLPMAVAAPPCLRLPRRSRCVGPFALFALSVGLSGAVFAQASPAPVSLALDDAVRAAETRSATLDGQDAAIRALRELEIAAGRLPDPALRLSLDNLPIEGPMRYSLTDDSMTMKSVSLMQTYIGSGKRLARSNRFARESDAATSMRAFELTKLRTQTATAWFARYYEQQMLELLRRQREEAMLTVEAVEAAYRGGRTTQADALEARAAVARIDDRLQEIRAELSNSQTQLERWVGDAATRPLGTPPRIDRTRLAAHALEHEVTQHPEIAFMTAKEQVALAEADLARREKDVDWSWSLTYSNRGSQFGDMVSVGVSIPLQWDRKNRQDRDLAAKLEQVEQVRAERDEMQREHIAEVKQLMTSWRSHLSRLADYDKTLIPLACARTQAQEAAFRGGMTPLSEVLEARRMEIDTRLERLRIERQTAELWAQLEFLIPDPPSFRHSPAPLSEPSTQGQKS